MPAIREPGAFFIVFLFSFYFWLIIFAAIVFGDPHMITIDGVEYTFNGHGEFIVSKVKNSTFILQGRMEPLSNENSQESRATVYTAFVSKEDGSDTVQVKERDRQKNH